MALRHRAIRECPEAFGTAREVELGRRESYYRRKLLALSRNPHEDILGLWDGDRLIGMAGYGRRSDRTHGVGAVLYSIYVVPDYRGRGLGSGLVETASLQCSTLWQSRWLVLHVEVSNRHARERYEALDFRVEATEHQAFRLGTQWYDVYCMRKWLG